MKERLFASLDKLDPRVIWLGMIAAAALVAFESWHFVLRAPLAKYQQLRETRVNLAKVVAATPREPAELSRLAAEVQGLSDRLNSELRASQSDEQLAARLMTELDRSAAASGAVLTGVKPTASTALGSFEEVAYEVAAEGKYLKVTSWMLDIERVLGPSAAVAELNMKATDSRDAAVTLKLALYRGRNPAPQAK